MIDALFLSLSRNYFSKVGEPFNVSLIQLASFLTQKKMKVKIIAVSTYGKEPEKIIEEKFHEYEPKYVVISLKWYDRLYSAIKTAKQIRSLNKDVKIIAGGHTASFFDKEILENSDIDIIVRGDGELPLLNILKNEKLINVTIKRNNKIIRTPITYVQQESDLKDFFWEHNLENILENTREAFSKNAQFVWLGKGCIHNCIYCSGCKENQKRLFKRKNVIFRPIKNVINDINILNNYSNLLVLDFDPLIGDNSYQIKLFREMGKRDLKITNILWHLPSKNLLELMNKIFKRTEIELDIVTFSESFRKFLARKNFIKPFFSNSQLEKMLNITENMDIKVRLDSIIGMPGETMEDIERGVNYVKKLSQNYPRSMSSLTFKVCMPLNAEPGSRIHVNPENFGLICHRKTFEDFLKFSKIIYEEDLNYPSVNYPSNRLEKHPYGIHPINLSEEEIKNRCRIFFNRLNEIFLHKN